PTPIARPERGRSQWPAWLRRLLGPLDRLGVRIRMREIDADAVGRYALPTPDGASASQAPVVARRGADGALGFRGPGSAESQPGDASARPLDLLLLGLIAVLALWLVTGRVGTGLQFRRAARDRAPRPPAPRGQPETERTCPPRFRHIQLVGLDDAAPRLWSPWLLPLTDLPIRRSLAAAGLAMTFVALTQTCTPLGGNHDSLSGLITVAHASAQPAARANGVRGTSSLTVGGGAVHGAEPCGYHSAH
ncbi:MAG TPA: hypothetical protein VFX49_03515, partial [Chloroflexota bacterium]|nr:hypothetical protein [Chloroflexota bacterium]